MDYFLVVIFGIVQGVTEFLPISSSGHLILLHNLYELPIRNELAFDVFLHFATLLAVIICFKEEIWNLAKSFLLSLAGKKDDYSKTAWLIIFATIPAALAGFLFDDLIENKLHDAEGLEIIIVATMLILVALLFLWIEKRPMGDKNFTSLSWKQAMLVGVAQAMALIPGTSRSGITIIAGLKSGLKREEALKFSFLLSIPIILGASLKKIPVLFETGIESSELYIILSGFFASLITGVLVIKFFLRYARANTLNVFAYYRIALAIILFAYLLVF